MDRQADEVAAGGDLAERGVDGDPGAAGPADGPAVTHEASAVDPEAGHDERRDAATAGERGIGEREGGAVAGGGRRRHLRGGRIGGKGGDDAAVDAGDEPDDL